MCKQLTNIKKTLLFCLTFLVILPSVVYGQETYRFERMWPTLPQPWYFNEPQGVAVAPDGSVYVADSGYFRIQKFNSDGHFISMWGREGAGNGEFGNLGTWGILPPGPKGIAVGIDGTVYVTDTHNHRIQTFTPDGVYLDQWGEEGEGEGQFRFPSSIAVDSSGNTYVTDCENHRVQKFDSNGDFDIEWGGYGYNDEEFVYPFGIALDSSGNVFVVDITWRIQKFAPDGTVIQIFSIPSTEDIHPRDIAIDNDDNIYVAIKYPSLIFKISSDGQLLESWGSHGIGEDELADPSGIALDNSEYLYVADSVNNRIKKLTKNGDLVNIWANYEAGDNLFLYPEGIAVGGNGSVYFTDNVGNCIHSFSGEGEHECLGEEGSGSDLYVLRWRGIAIDDVGNLYVCDKLNNRIQKFSLEGQLITMWGSGDDLPLQPEGIALDSNGNVYVTDHAFEVDPVMYHIFRNRVQKFSPNADGTAYTFERLWETWGEENETFYSPSGIGVGIDQDQGPDGSGTEYVYVADRRNNYVHKFTLDGQYITTWTGPEENDTFDDPWGIATDENGNVYVADRWNYRVLKLTPEGSLITSFGGFGSGPGQLGEFHYIAVDSDEKVYVADKYNNRIQVFTKTEGIGNNKAVIVAGGGPYPGNHLWDATQMTANFAYRTLRHQGFGTEDIYYLTSDTDLDLDNDGVSNVFDAPNNQRLNDAIHLAVGDNVDNLVLYLTDHGGIDEDGTGIFRMNQSETLTSTDLATMLDAVQTSIANRSSVIIDACQSGSFIDDDLLGDNRIIITSSSEAQQAKFLNQGTISFSHFFWSNIFNGASLDLAFFNASWAVDFAISDQTPLKAGDTQDVYIGNATAGMLGEVPGIEGEVVSLPEELTIENSAVLSVDGVCDPNNDTITRVWAVIWPPDYDTGTIDDPLLELPTIDLYPVGANSYEGSYTEFHAVGTYQIAVYAMDEHGNTSLPKFSIVPKNVSRRAVIVAGPEAPDITWQMIEHNAGLAYNTLISQHYGSGDIYFMSPTTFLEDVITYLPEIANFEDQLFTLASDEDIVTLDLTIYLIGESEDGNFILNDDPNEYETLSASQLDEWLDDLQTLKSGRITVICDFNQSGSFILQHTLPEGNQQITITSTGEETAAYFNTAGNISFSSFLWDQLAAGATIGDAFIYAREAIAYCSRTNDVSFSCYRPQSPLIDANSNGTPNETIDYGMVEKIKIGDGIVTANDPPQIGSVSAVREGEMITITAEDISSTSPVSRVWAIINPLLYCPGSSESSPQVTAEVDLEGPDADGKYTYTYPADYACKITVYAMSGTEEEPNISLPKEIRIYQEGGDIYEPDNYPSDANVIVVNYPTAQPHTFHGRDDEDWVKFYGLENDEADSIEDVYTVEASNLGENCPVIELYDADNLTVPIAVASNPPVDGKVWIDYRFQRNGIYYLRLVWGGCDWVEGKMHYDLKVFDGNQGLTAIVRGKVRDRISGAPINGAVIRSNGVGATISTHGEYLLSEIPGNWTITARKNGYTNSRAGIRIESVDQQIRKDIRMAPRIKRCSEDADCVDGDYCNGIEICVDEVCQPGTGPCGDDGLYCNGEEVGCDEENDICVHSGSPCPGHQACVEESEECIDKECTGNEDCNDGRFCNGTEVCTNGLCQAGIYPCAEPTPECDEDQDICVEGPSIQLFPNPHLQLRWMPLLMFLRIVGTNTHFDDSTEVTYDPPGSVMALPILGDEKHLFIIGFILPSWLAPVESVDVTVSTPTGGEIVSEKLNLEFPFSQDNS